jgi:hypothetical protein
MPDAPIRLELFTRITPQQMALARAACLLRAGPVQAALGVIALLLGGGALRFCSDLHRAGLAALWDKVGPLCLLSSVLLLLSALLLALLRSPLDRLTRLELRHGALLQLDAGGLTATVRGATLYYTWDHVCVHGSWAGLVFRLPRGAFHLLPWAAVPRESVEPLLRLLVAAGKREGARALPHSSGPGRTHAAPAPRFATTP